MQVLSVIAQQILQIQNAIKALPDDLAKPEIGGETHVWTPFRGRKRLKIGESR